MDPATGIMIHMNGTTITRDLKRTIRNRIHMKPLADYYTERFNWNDRTRKNIDWDIFGRAYRKKKQKRNSNGSTNFISETYQQEKE